MQFRSHSGRCYPAFLLRSLRRQGRTVLADAPVSVKADKLGAIPDTRSLFKARMSQALRTVAVHHPLDHSVRMVINENDMRSHHVPWGHVAEMQTPAEAEEALESVLEADNIEPLPAFDIAPAGEYRITKGPRGKWYVKNGKEAVAGPFETEGEANAARP